MTSKNSLSFTRHGEGYLCVASSDTEAWPIHIKKRVNDTWKATIYCAETAEELYSEIGLTRIKIAREAAEWLYTNKPQLKYRQMFHDIETEAVANIIADNDNRSLSILMENDVTIKRDSNGEFQGLEINIELDEDEDDTDELV